MLATGRGRKNGKPTSSFHNIYRCAQGQNQNFARLLKSLKTG